MVAARVPARLVEAVRSARAMECDCAKCSPAPRVEELWGSELAAVALADAILAAPLSPAAPQDGAEPDCFDALDTRTRQLDDALRERDEANAAKTREVLLHGVTKAELAAERKARAFHASDADFYNAENIDALRERDAARFLARGWRLFARTERDRADSEAAAANRALVKAQTMEFERDALRSHLAQLDALGSALAESVVAYQAAVGAYEHHCRDVGDAPDRGYTTDRLAGERRQAWHEMDRHRTAWAMRAETGATRGEGR